MSSNSPSAFRAANRGRAIKKFILIKGYAKGDGPLFLEISAKGDAKGDGPLFLAKGDGPLFLEISAKGDGPLFLEIRTVPLLHKRRPPFSGRF
jgi:hypothetical protein